LFPTSNIELPNTNKAGEEEGFGKHGLEKPKDERLISMKKKPKWWVCECEISSIIRKVE